ncbi:putative helicase mov-10-B.1, partial [Ruditapes philippinarum]|uniref:putative helicase mov-10-B.1 n=1 Tax=Ruditapes philippinarum TaxID=129788 RepID=UPI00295AB36F
MRRRNRGTSAGEETRVFIKYLTDNDHPDVIKRDDLKAIYEGEFLLHRRNSNPHYTDIKYRDVLRYLRYKNMIHELGDYYIFGKDVQGEYGNIIGSEDYRKTLEKWQEKAACTPNFCGVCGVQCPGEKDFDQHQNGTRHRIHKFHYDIYKNRDQMLTCPSGIEIESVPMVNTSLLIEKECRPKDEVFMLISIKNKSRDWHTLLLRRFLLLWDTGVFRLVQKDNTRPPRSKFHIQPGTSVEIRVQCKAPVDFGHHFVPLAFYFEWMDRNNKLIQDTADQHSEELVPRFVSVHVLGDLHEAMAPIGPYKPPEEIPDEHVEETVPGEPCPKSGKNMLGGKLSQSFVPPVLMHQVKKGLNAKNEILDLKLRRAIDCDLNITNYKSKFDTLLWTEELQMIKDIKIYDLKSHEMTLDMHRRVMILEVPGLMERRPSIMRGDRVYIFADGNRNVRYEGIVHKVELETVDLGVSKRLRDTWIKGKRYEIRFDFLKFNLWIQHRALTGLKYAETILFPSEETSLSEREDNFPLKPWFDRNVNEEQRTAVANIVKGTSRPGPYLIFGPPGTGKTVTVTEAIRQIYHNQPEARILACCPENTAADFLMKKLINPNQPGTIKKNDIFRLYAMSRPKITIPKEIMDSKQLNS